jgi:hypothetical protein
VLASVTLSTDPHDVTVGQGSQMAVTIARVDPASAFLSYSRADKPLAHELGHALAQRGVKVWIDELELRSGDSIIERVAQAIADGDFLVAIVSPDSIKSAWCQRELALAATKGIKQKSIVVLPVRYRNATMPAALADRFWLDADTADVVALADRIVADISRHRGDREHVADTARSQRGLRLLTKNIRRRRWPLIAAGLAATATAAGGILASGILDRGPTAAAKKCGTSAGDPKRRIFCVDDPCESYPSTCTLPEYAAPKVSPPVGELEDGQQIKVRCQVRGEPFRGDNGVSSIWDRLEDGHYVTDYFVNTRGSGSDKFQDGIPRC